jgi:hypothetical protein
MTTSQTRTDFIEGYKTFTARTSHDLCVSYAMGFETTQPKVGNLHHAIDPAEHVSFQVGSRPPSRGGLTATGHPA